jgi:hypothetical protein
MRIKLEFDKSLSQAHKINTKMFGTRFDGFEFIVCKSAEEFMKKSKSVSNKFTAMAFKDRKIIIKNMKTILKEGRWKKEYIPKIITHEINHMYWYHIKKTWSPYWLCEGVAMHAGDNLKVDKEELQRLIKKYQVTSAILEFRYISKRFKNGHEPRYQIWGDFTRYLINKYGLKKVMKICLQNTKKDYELMFRKEIGNDRTLFNEYLEVYK